MKMKIHTTNIKPNVSALFKKVMGVTYKAHLLIASPSQLVSQQDTRGLLRVT